MNEMHEALEAARIDEEIETTQMLIRMFKMHGVKATQTNIRDTKGDSHPAVILTTDTYNDMIALLQDIGIHQLTKDLN